MKNFYSSKTWSTIRLNFLFACLTWKYTPLNRHYNCWVAFIGGCNRRRHNCLQTPMRSFALWTVMSITSFSYLVVLIENPLYWVSLFVPRSCLKTSMTGVSQGNSYLSYNSFVRAKLYFIWLYWSCFLSFFLTFFHFRKYSVWKFI